MGQKSSAILSQESRLSFWVDHLDQGHRSEYSNYEYATAVTKPSTTPKIVVSCFGLTL